MQKLCNEQTNILLATCLFLNVLGTLKYTITARNANRF
jgi:hypothetical protein